MKVHNNMHGFLLDFIIATKEQMHSKKVNKHKELKARFNKIKVPHRFYYCVPTGMITKQEVPDYAGLLYTDGYSITLVKQAPFIHKEKLDLSKILLDKFYYLSLDLKQQINLSKYKKTF